MALRGGRVFSQEGGMGVARLKDSPLPEARMVPECEDCARLSSVDDHASVTSDRAAVLTTSCRASPTRRVPESDTS